MKDDSKWKEHTSHTIHQEKEHMVSEQEWKRKTVEKWSLQEELKVEKDYLYNSLSGTDTLVA